MSENAYNLHKIYGLFVFYVGDAKIGDNVILANAGNSRLFAGNHKDSKRLSLLLPRTTLLNLRTRRHVSKFFLFPLLILLFFAAPLISQTITTYDYVGVTPAGGPHDAYNCDVDAMPPEGADLNSKVEAAAGDYTNISTSNNVRWNTASAGAGDEVFFWSDIVITEDPNDITQIDFSFEGQPDSNSDMELWLYNQSDLVWELKASVAATADTDITVTYTMTSGFDTYISGTGTITWGINHATANMLARFDYCFVKVYVVPIISYTGDTAYGSSITGVTSASSPITYTIGNTGNATLTVTNIQVTGGNSGDWSLGGLPSFPATVPVGGTITFTGSFTPAGTAARTTTLRVTSNHYGVAGTNSDLTLTGEGIDPADPAVSVSGTDDFGDSNVGAVSATSPATITVSNVGGSALTITNIALVGSKTHTYGFSGITGSGPHYAYRKSVTTTPPTATNTSSTDQASSSEYTQLATSDNSRWVTQDPGGANEMFILATMAIDESPNDITQIDMTFEGQGAGGTDFQVWALNQSTSTWGQVGGSITLAANTDGSMTRSINVGISDYISSDGTFIWGVYQTDSSDLVRVDFMQVVVTYNAGGNFSLSGLPSFPAVVAAGGNTTFTASFTPTALGLHDSSIRVTSDHGGTAGTNVDYAIEGTGTQPEVSVSGTQDFDDGYVGYVSDSSPITYSIGNDGEGDLTVDGIEIRNGSEYLFDTTTNAGGPHNAYYLDINTMPPIPGNQNAKTEIGDVSYAQMVSSDDVRWNATDPGNGDYVFVEFNIALNEAAADVERIDMTWEGQAAEATAFQIWAYNQTTTTWVQVGTGVSAIANTDVTMTRSITASAGNYCTDGTLYWGVYSTDDSDVVRTDYARTVVTTNDVSADFAVNTAPSFPFTVAPGDTEDFTVDFTASATGTRRGVLYIDCDSENTSAQWGTLGIYGNGLTPVPVIDISGTQDFGQGNIGSASPSSPIFYTVTNDGVLDLVVTAITLAGADPGEFSLANLPGFPETVVPGDNFQFTASFEPTATGTKNADIRVTSNTGGVAGTNTDYAITGEGVIGPVIDISGTQSFGNSNVGTTSATSPITYTVTNEGDLDLTVTAVAIQPTATSTYDFSSTTTAGPHNAFRCDIDQLPPTGGNLNSKTEAVDANYTSIGSSDDVRWTTQDPGTGDFMFIWSDMVIDEPAGDITQIDMFFNGQCNLACNFQVWAFNQTTSTWTQFGGNTAAGAATDTDVTQSIGANFADYLGSNQTLSWGVYCDVSSELVNVDYLRVTVSKDVDADWSLSNVPGLPAVIAPGNTITFDVSFTPTQLGTRSTNIQVTSDTGSVPGTVTNYAISGVGTQPIAGLSGTADFGSEATGFSTDPITYTVNNTGTGTLTISAIAVTGGQSGDFSLAGLPGSFPATVAAGGNLQFTGTFSPTATGFRTTTLRVTSDSLNVAGTNTDLTIYGTGTTPVPTISITGTQDFGSATELTTSASSPITYTIANTGTATLTITAIALAGNNPGDFSLANVPGLPTTITVGNNFTIEGSFTPTTTGLRTAKIRVTSDTGGVAGTNTDRDIQGTGVSSTAGILEITGTQDFGSSTIGLPSPTSPITYTVENIGAGDLTVTAISMAGTNPGDFSLSGLPGFPQVLSTSQTFTFQCTFTPGAATSRSALIRTTSDHYGTPGTNVDYSVSGTGTSTPGLWTGYTNSNWATASNWGNNQVPSNIAITIPDVTNDPVISSAVSNVTTLTINSNGSLTITGSGTLQTTNTITVNSGGSLTVAAGGALTATNGTVSVSGTLILDDNGALTLGNGNLTVNSGGALRTTGSSSSAANTAGTIQSTVAGSTKWQLVVADGGSVDARGARFIDGYINPSGTAPTELRLTDVLFSSLPNGVGNAFIDLRTVSSGSIAFGKLTFTRGTGVAIASAANIRADTNTQEIYVIGYAGDIGGETFDNDAFGKIHWINNTTPVKVVGGAGSTAESLDEALDSLGGGTLQVFASYTDGSGDLVTGAQTVPGKLVLPNFSGTLELDGFIFRTTSTATGIVLDTSAVTSGGTVKLFNCMLIDPYDSAPATGRAMINRGAGNAEVIAEFCTIDTSTRVVAGLEDDNANSINCLYTRPITAANYINSADRNYHLTLTGNSAIANGTGLLTAGHERDIDGVVRPDATNSDLGADYYGSNGTAASIISLTDITGGLAATPAMVVVEGGSILGVGTQAHMVASYDESKDRKSVV